MKIVPQEMGRCLAKMGKCPFRAKKKKKQHFALFLKLIREILLFCNSIIWKSRFIEELDHIIVKLASDLCHASKADVVFSN